jgi:hypothetical protein
MPRRRQSETIVAGICGGGGCGFVAGWGPCCARAALNDETSNNKPAEQAFLFRICLIDKPGSVVHA